MRRRGFVVRCSLFVVGCWGKAMQQITPERPYRGPNYFQNNDLGYFDTTEGSINSLQGIEEIQYKQKNVYKLFYHGGMIN